MLKFFHDLTLLLFQMPPKGARTRHSTGGCFGAACPLPDIGSLYTTRDILAAIAMEVILNPSKAVRWAVVKVAPAVRAKWDQTNPQLVLIPESALLLRMTRIYERALQVNNNKLSAKAKKIFTDSLDKVFDILVCQCPFEKCLKPDCNPAHCYDEAHITCTCLRAEKIPAMELLFIMDQREKIGLRGEECKWVKLTK